MKENKQKTKELTSLMEELKQIAEKEASINDGHSLDRIMDIYIQKMNTYMNVNEIVS